MPSIILNPPYVIPGHTIKTVFGEGSGLFLCHPLHADYAGGVVIKKANGVWYAITKDHPEWTWGVGGPQVGCVNWDYRGHNISVSCKHGRYANDTQDPSYIGSKVYENGFVLANAPGGKNIYGMCLRLDPAQPGAEVLQLIIVTHNITTHVNTFYSRPYVGGDDGLYNAETNPSGWYAFATCTENEKDYEEPNTIWLFNQSGTEAHVLRHYKLAPNTTYAAGAFLKLTLGEATASLTHIDARTLTVNNSYSSVSTPFATGNNPATGLGDEYEFGINAADNDSESTIYDNIVAMDYIGDVLTTLTYKKTITTTVVSDYDSLFRYYEPVAGDFGTFPYSKDSEDTDFLTTKDYVFSEELFIDGALFFTLHDSRYTVRYGVSQHYTRTWGVGDPGATYSETSDALFPSSYSGAVHTVDLRYKHGVFQRQHKVLDSVVPEGTQYKTIHTYHGELDVISKYQGTEVYHVTGREPCPDYFMTVAGDINVIEETKDTLALTYPYTKFENLSSTTSYTLLENNGSFSLSLDQPGGSFGAVDAYAASPDGFIFSDDNWCYYYDGTPSFIGEPYTNYLRGGDLETLVPPLGETPSYHDVFAF